MTPPAAVGPGGVKVAGPPPTLYQQLVGAWTAKIGSISARIAALEAAKGKGGNDAVIDAKIEEANQQKLTAEAELAKIVTAGSDGDLSSFTLPGGGTPGAAAPRRRGGHRAAAPEPKPPTPERVSTYQPDVVGERARGVAGTRRDGVSYDPGTSIHPAEQPMALSPAQTANLQTLRGNLSKAGMSGEEVDAYMGYLEFRAREEKKPDWPGAVLDAQWPKDPENQGVFTGPQFRNGRRGKITLEGREKVQLLDGAFAYLQDKAGRAKATFRGEEYNVDTHGLAVVNEGKRFTTGPEGAPRNIRGLLERVKTYRALDEYRKTVRIPDAAETPLKGSDEAFVAHLQSEGLLTNDAEEVEQIPKPTSLTRMAGQKERPGAIQDLYDYLTGPTKLDDDLTAAVSPAPGRGMTDQEARDYIQSLRFPNPEGNEPPQVGVADADPTRIREHRTTLESQGTPKAELLERAKGQARLDLENEVTRYFHWQDNPDATRRYMADRGFGPGSTRSIEDFHQETETYLDKTARPDEAARLMHDLALRHDEIAGKVDSAHRDTYLANFGGEEDGPEFTERLIREYGLKGKDAKELKQFSARQRLELRGKLGEERRAEAAKIREREREHAYWLKQHSIEREERVEDREDEQAHQVGLEDQRHQHALEQADHQASLKINEQLLADANEPAKIMMKGVWDMLAQQGSRIGQNVAAIFQAVSGGGGGMGGYA